MGSMLTMLIVLNFFDQLQLFVIEIDLITGRAHPIFDFIFIFAKNYACNDGRGAGMGLTQSFNFRNFLQLFKTNLAASSSALA